MSVFIFALLCLCVVNADICTQSSACVTTRCPGCSVFTTSFFQTNAQTKTTFVAFNVSNQCTQSAAKPGVIFVAFNLNSPSQGLTLTPSITSGTYQGANYQWTVDTGAPDGTDALPAPKPTNYLKFTARGAGVVNGHQTKMSLAAGNLNYEIFRFSVTGYDPTYNWVFRFHYADQYEAHGYIDISNCQCDSCDSNHQKRVVQQCTLGYPDGSSSRASTIFNEDLILYSFAATNNINNVGANLISLYYSDEYPLMLGIDRIVEGGQSTLAPTPPAFAAVPQAPTCIGINGAINFGYPVADPKVKTASVDNSGTANQCKPSVAPVYTCPRPLPPSLFLTDITDNPAARSGDWQQNGTAYLPQKICGLYYYSRKVINSVAADGTVTADVLGFQSISGLTLPPTNSLGGLLPPWNFGEGADPIPVFAPTNPATNRYEYGTQVAWDVSKLPLRDARNYRFQIMAHDGDSTKVGGDIGEACVNIIVQCDAGFVNNPGDATPCSSCDLTPLPGDGKWTWFASPAAVPLPGPDSPLANVYILTKVPKSKLTQEPYKTYLADGTGFIPGPGVIDKAGFAITCDAKRIIKPCPLNCCGNGKCDYTKGVCQCFGPPEGLLDTNTCCPTNAPTKTPTVAPTSTGAPTVFLQPTSAPTPPTEAPTNTPCFNNGAGCNGANGVCNVALDKCNCTDPAFLQPDCRAPPCFNNGRYCNGNGACVNETCVCNDPAFLLPDCSAPPPPQPKCTDIISSNNIDCKICVDDPIAKQLGCVYCPPPGNRTDPLVGGTCVSANSCAKPAASCQPVVVTIPPQCADNCSGNGICVNLTYCRQLEVENKAKYGNNTDQYPLNCGENANKSQSYNQTGACACYPGFTGFNCGLVGSKTLVALAALGAGLIALIVIMALLGAAMCGGGAVAVSQGVTSDASGTVISSPLYESSAGSGTNPLATEAYELF